MVDKDKVLPLPLKLVTIQEFPCPTTQRKLQEFLGLINFYHWFLPHGTEVLQPLLTLPTQSRGNLELQWCDETMTAFELKGHQQKPRCYPTQCQKHPQLSWQMPQIQPWGRYCSSSSSLFFVSLLNCPPLSIGIVHLAGSFWQYTNLFSIFGILWRGVIFSY